MSDQASFVREFPAMTAAQRLYLDIHGYVIIEKTISADKVKTIVDKMYEIEDIFRATGKLPKGVSTIFSNSPNLFRIDNLPHIDPCFLDYLTDPRLVALVEEAMGGEARLEQSDAHILRPKPGEIPGGYGFHNGMHDDFAMTRNGLYHLPFVKTLEIVKF